MRDISLFLVKKSHNVFESDNDREGWLHIQMESNDGFYFRNVTRLCNTGVRLPVCYSCVSRLSQAPVRLQFSIPLFLLRSVCPSSPFSHHAEEPAPGEQHSEERETVVSGDTGDWIQHLWDWIPRSLQTGIDANGDMNTESDSCPETVLEGVSCP